jgi:hypothetical protein
VAGEDGITIGKYNTGKWVATKLVVDSSYTACSVKINFAQSGTPALTLTACIYTDSTGPSTQVGDCSSAINESAIVDTDTYTFTVSAALSTGTYWIVLKRNNYDTTNYFSWRQVAGYCANCSYTSTDGSSWSVLHQLQEYVIYK